MGSKFHSYKALHVDKNKFKVLAWLSLKCFKFVHCLHNGFEQNCGCIIFLFHILTFNVCSLSRSKKKSQALSNCFGNSLLLSHMTKMDHTKRQKQEDHAKRQKQEEKKVVEPIKIIKPVDPEPVSPAPKAPGLKLTINLKKSSVSKPEICKEVVKKPTVKKSAIQQQPILGKLVVRNEKKKILVSKSILFPPVVVVPTIQDDDEPQTEKTEKLESGKDKSKKEKRREKKPKDEPRKVPKLVIKRDSIVAAVNSRNKDARPDNFPMTSPSCKSDDAPDPATPLSAAKKSIKILPIKIPLAKIQPSDSKSVKVTLQRKKRGPKTKKENTTNAKVDNVSPQRKTRLNSRTNSVVTTEGSNEKSVNEPALTNGGTKNESLKTKILINKSGAVREVLRPVVPRLKIRLGPSVVESGKQLSVILSDLVHDDDDDEGEMQECSLQISKIGIKMTRSFDDILNERRSEEVSAGSDVGERTCVVRDTDIGSALSAILSLELEKGIVATILDETLAKVVEEGERRVAKRNDDLVIGQRQSQVAAPLQQEQEVGKEKMEERESRSQGEVKSGLKMILTRKDDQFVAKSDAADRKSKSESEKPDEFAIIRIPSLSARPKPKRAGSGLSGSDYTKRRARRKLDKIIIKNLSRLSKGSSLEDDATTADETEPLVPAVDEEVKGVDKTTPEATSVEGVAAIQGIAAADGNDGDKAIKKVCASLLDQLIDSLFCKDAVADAQTLKVPPLKIKSSQLSIKKKKEKGGKKEETNLAKVLMLKEEDVCFKRVVPPLKLVLGQSKKQELVKPDGPMRKPVIRKLKVILTRIDSQVVTKDTESCAKQISESPKAKLPKRKIDTGTELESSSKRFNGPSCLTVEPTLTAQISKKKDETKCEKTQPELAPVIANTESSSSVRRRSLSGKNVERLSSDRRRRHPSAAGKLEASVVEAMYRPRKSILEAFSETSRRHSLPDLELPKSKTMIAVSTSNPSTPAKPTVFPNPPVFARKSVPKLLDLLDEDPAAKMSTHSQPQQPPSIPKPVILEAKQAEETRATSPAEDHTPEQAPASSDPDNAKQVEENLVIRKAIDIIRQTPDTDKVFNMIDELFDNVMDIAYKSDKPEPELICESILDDLISLVITVNDDKTTTNGDQQDASKEQESEETSDPKTHPSPSLKLPSPQIDDEILSVDVCDDLQEAPMEQELESSTELESKGIENNSDNEKLEDTSDSITHLSPQRVVEISPIDTGVDIQGDSYEQELESSTELELKTEEVEKSKETSDSMPQPSPQRGVEISVIADDHQEAPLEPELESKIEEQEPAVEKAKETSDSIPQPSPQRGVKISLIADDHQEAPLEPELESKIEEQEPEVKKPEEMEFIKETHLLSSPELSSPQIDNVVKPSSRTVSEVALQDDLVEQELESSTELESKIEEQGPEVEKSEEMEFINEDHPSNSSQGDKVVKILTPDESENHRGDALEAEQDAAEEDNSNELDELESKSGDQETQVKTLEKTELSTDVNSENLFQSLKTGFVGKTTLESPQREDDGVDCKQLSTREEETEMKRNRRRSSRNSMDESEPKPKLRRRSTRSASAVGLVEIVENVLIDLITDAVYLSESKSSREEAWAAILATARPAPEATVSSPEMRFSSEVETDDDSAVFNARNNDLQNCLPYQVIIQF